MKRKVDIGDYPLRTTDKVRYADTDRQGHVNNSVFSIFLETGRVEFLYEINSSLAGDKGEFVIAKLLLEFCAEVCWPGVVEIGTRVAGVGRSSINLEQAVFQGSRCVALAETVIVLINKDARRSMPISDESLGILRSAKIRL